MTHSRFHPNPHATLSKLDSRLELLNVEEEREEEEENGKKKSKKFNHILRTRGGGWACSSHTNWRVLVAEDHSRGTERTLANSLCCPAFHERQTTELWRATPRDYIPLPFKKSRHFDFINGVSVPVFRIFNPFEGRRPTLSTEVYLFFFLLLLFSQGTGGGLVYTRDLLFTRNVVLARVDSCAVRHNWWTAPPPRFLKPAVFHVGFDSLRDYSRYIDDKRISWRWIRDRNSNVKGNT